MSHKTLKLSLFSLLSVTILVSQLSAAITINVTAEKLKDPGGFDMATTGVVALVADIGTPGFSGPSGTALEGDDFLVAAWNIASSGGNVPGAFLGSTGSISFSGDWAEGDDLALYFFPTLTLTNPPASAAAVPYGMFRVTAANLDGTDLWVTPPDGTLAINLKVITTDATALGTGTTPAADGLADGVTTGTPPAAPTGIAAAVNGLTLNVTWTDNASDETGYRIERSLNGSGIWTILDTLAPGVTLFVDSTVASNTAYLYRVIALRPPSQSAYNTTATATTSATGSGRFNNLSTRALVGTGDEILIASFRVDGGPLRIYLRVGGPDLEAAGISNFLANPTMELRKVDGNVLIKSNDDWKTTQFEVEGVVPGGLVPKFDVDPAMVVNLPDPGNYSVIVRGVGDTIGFANVELYEFKDPAEPNSGKLTNISVRALVGTVDEILIASFRVAGDASQGIYSRIAGPDLEASGIPNFLADPTAQLFKIGDLIAIKTNNDWKDDESEIVGTVPGGFIPKFEVDPAMVVRLTQNESYSVVVRGVNDTTGFAVVELFDFAGAP
ncbi:MAG: fibronectin type III domain-containing protein [Verrucomicrobia bacterium]|nr:fibronectin type III domain-containing protein [Verrucomicrobiota bacterium]MDA1067938.1 fibronectin type III domain-containing protein [Verrucomicrobiota bacterium]